MQKYLFGLIFIGITALHAQVSGNVEYEKGYADYSHSSSSKSSSTSYDRIYLSDTTLLIPAAVLINVKADQYVAVWAVKEESKTISQCVSRLDTRINAFMQNLKKMNIPDSDLFIDFISEHPIYDYALTGNVAEEKLEGFEVQKNVTVRFDRRSLFDTLAVLASQNEIYDLVKVDYYVNSSTELRSRLFEEAVKIIHRKKDLYAQKLNVKLKTNAQVYTEDYEIYFPSEMYNSYLAYEGGNIKKSAYYSSSKTDSWIKEKRKSKTFFYNGLSVEGFDLVINPMIIEPAVQFTLKMSVRYELVR